MKQTKARQPAPSDPEQAAAYKRAQEISPRLLRVTVKKSGGNLFEENSYENGKTAIRYIYNGWIVYRPIEWPADKALALPVGYRDSPVKGGMGSDFPDADWIKPAVFVKTVTYHGQRCYYYEDKEAPPLTGGDALNPNPSKGVRAWIDAKTRLPVAVEDDAVLKKFSFLKEAPPSIELTGVFAAAYNNALHTNRPAGASSPPR